VPTEPGAIGDAIAELERTLPSLRQRRDEFVTNVAQLEMMFVTLKAFKEQLTLAGQLANSALADAEKAARELLAKLRT
jgi:hypothetical protein